MSKKKLPPGITPRGYRWRIDTFYKGVRIRESCATPEMAEANLRKIQTLVDEGRYLEKKRDPKETLGEFSKKYLKWCEDTQERGPKDRPFSRSWWLEQALFVCSVIHRFSLRSSGKWTLRILVNRSSPRSHQLLLRHRK